MGRRRSEPEPQEAQLNRELSWLDFNERVLELSGESSLPLLERVRFCSIFSSNLDQFFMVRVAGLRGQVAAQVLGRSPDGRTAAQTLREIRARVLELSATQARLWQQELRPALEREGIVLAGASELRAEELAELEDTFERQVYPLLTPLALGPGQPFPYISGLSLSLAVIVRDPDDGEERFARVKVPESIARFLAVGAHERFVPLEEAIRHFLPRLFPSMEAVEWTVFRVTRDADFSLSDEADDLLEAVEAELRLRRFGAPVRLEVAASASPRLVAQLVSGLDVDDESVYRAEALLGLADVLELTALDRPELKLDPWRPVTPPRFAAPRGGELFAEIAHAEALVHHPYESFGSSFGAFLHAAVRDPAVAALKTTVYRTSPDSPNVPALIEAAEEGKQTVALVELTARFDERRNIEWSRALEQAGVHVVHGPPHLKVHAKTTLVVRRERDGLRRYVHIGSGNYNSATARGYEDFGLFTADEEIAADIADLFNYLTGFGVPQRFRKLLVAPFNLRARLTHLIRDCTAAAASGEPARIRIKVNHLGDDAIVRELYAAADAGVAVEIFARTTCTLLPRQRGKGDDIRVRTVLGRFFEHSRFCIFESGRAKTYLIGSADLLPRNLDHRIEIMTPIEDADARRELEKSFDAIMEAGAYSWELRSDGRWHRLRPEHETRVRDMQAVLMRRARARARRGSTGARSPDRR